MASFSICRASTSVPPDDDALQFGCPNPPGRWLKHIESEVVSLVEFSWTGIVVVPMAVVDRNPHFGRIAVVQTVGTAKVFVPPEVLRVVDVRVVEEAVPIERRVGMSPCPTVGLFSLGYVAARQDQHDGGQGNRKTNPAGHRISPWANLGTGSFCGGHHRRDGRRSKMCLSPFREPRRGGVAVAGTSASVVASAAVTTRIE